MVLPVVYGRRATRQRGAVAQALVLEAPRRLAGRELPLPNLGDDDALVRVADCGLCGTDHEQFTGELAGTTQGVA